MKPYFFYPPFFFTRTVYFFNIIINVVRLMCLLKQNKKAMSRSLYRLPWRFRLSFLSLSLSRCFLSVFLYEALKKIDPKFCADPFQTFPDFGASIPLARICFFVFLDSQFVNFLIWNFGLLLSLLWFHGKKSFWICLDLNSTRTYVRQASSASLSASRPFCFFFNVMPRVVISV